MTACPVPVTKACQLSAHLESACRRPVQEPVVKSLADAGRSKWLHRFVDWNGECSNRSAFCGVLSDAIVSLAVPELWRQPYAMGSWMGDLGEIIPEIQ